MIVAGAAVALMSWLIPSLLAKVVASDVIDPKDVSATARQVIELRALMPLLGLPSVVLGIVVLRKVPLRWLWTALGLLSTVLPMVLLVYVFVATIGLLYQPQDLK
jgi:hypothetical protein